MQIVLVNDQDKIVGYREKFSAHKIPVPLHRAISVIILDSSGKKMLLQKRAEGKPTWPLFWSNACCTHPYKNESYLESAERRIREEMGFEADLKEIFRFIYRADYDEVWGEHEYDVVFEGWYKGEVKPEPAEAADWKWMGVKELLGEVKNDPGVYTPWFKIILEKLYGVKSTLGPGVFVKHLE